MSYKSIVLLSMFTALLALPSMAQVKVKPYRSKVSQKGNFGKYPTKVRFAPVLTFGSAGAKYKLSDSLYADSAYQSKIVNDINYRTMGTGIENRSQFGIGLMLDIPFSRHITFRPTFMYSTKTIADVTDFVYQDSLTNANLIIQANNEKKINQFESMFMLQVNFGSDRKKTRFFLGGGFGFGLNTSATNDYDYTYVSTALDNPDQIWLTVDTSGSTDLGIGGNVYDDFYDRLDFMFQIEAGANIGNNITISGHYNASMGTMMTDPRFATFAPYYYGIKLAYIFGLKPDLWGY